MPRPLATGRPGSMALPSSVAQAGQAVEDRSRPDTITFTRGAQHRVKDGNTGAYTDAAPTEVYDGACRIIPEEPRGAGQRTEGEREISEQRYIVSIPYDSIAVRKNDIGTVGSCQNDPNLVGKELLVAKFINSSVQTARRMICTIIES
jgi:hypothetical protein